MEVTEEVGTSVSDPGVGGGGHTDVRYVTQGNGLGGPSHWFRYVFDDPLPQSVPGSISKLGHAPPHRPPTPAAVRW